MSQEMREASWIHAEAEALKTENRRLRAVLGLKAPPGFSPLWVHVIERDPLHWYRSLMVDAGSQQGVAPNAPVLGLLEGGMAAVGRVTEVRGQSALVLLLSDDLSSVAAILSSSTAEGLILGQGGPRLLMNYLSPDVDLRIGERVYTSPTSATFPPLVLIGTVGKIHPPDPFLTFQSAEVHPALDASFLQELLILRRTPGALNVPEESP
jgi:rod shape-determining protein MreC